MFEIFGIIPLIKILVISFVLILSSFFIGSIITGNNTKNLGVQFLIGLLSIIGLIAIIITQGISIFTPAILSLIIFFKPKLKINIRFLFLLKRTLQLYSFFIVFLLIELFRNNYFSGTLLTKGYRDYGYYLSLISGIIDTGKESTQIYLEYFGQNAAVNFYHYFDIYIFFLQSFLPSCHQ